MKHSSLSAGVMGWPVAHSLSPRLHGYWLKHYGITGSYQAIPVAPEQLESTLKNLAQQGLRGVNLTVPHKESALRYINHVDSLAARVGAINTVIVQDGGGLEGRNTDVFGFMENLRQAGYKADDRAATLIGAGGAARAALVGLMDAGIRELRLVNRTRERAESLAAAFPDAKISVFDWGDPQALDGAGLLANATSLGLKSQPPLDYPLNSLPTDAWVTDMVYAPLETDLLKRARARGNPTIDGLGMLLHQARPAFQAFFGPDPEVTEDLRRSVLEGL